MFTVLLDFDTDFFTGQDLWLDIAVRPAGRGAFTPLNPRQPITPMLFYRAVEESP